MIFSPIRSDRIQCWNQNNPLAAFTLNCDFLLSREDTLITLDMDSRILLYRLILDHQDPARSLDLERTAEIRVGDLVTHPACVVSLQLTALNHEAGAATFCSGVDTVLLNVSGRLITLHPKKRDKGARDDELHQV